MDRREFLRSGALVGAGMAAAGGAFVAGRESSSHADATGAETVRDVEGLDGLPAREGEDVLLRMQRELKVAMAKPVEDRHWAMVIDTRMCVGCHACTIGCVAENKLPPGVVYRPVITEERGEFPNVQLRYTPRPCMHCTSPACVPVCPVKATWKRPDGVVTIDYDRCIGCRYCMTACPYIARTSDFGLNYTDKAPGALSGKGVALLGAVAGQYEQRHSHEYAKHWMRNGHESPIGNARKCHFCVHRLDVGQLPVCVTTCIGRATTFGDVNNSDSLVSELVTRNQTQTLLPHYGLKPNVFYIV